MGGSTSGALGPALLQDYPEIEQTLRDRISLVFVDYEHTLYREAISLVDPHFFDVFDFPLWKGDVETVFETPYAAVVTRKMAERVFGKEDPIGKVFSIIDRDFKGEYAVTGVVDEITTGSLVYFDFLITTVNPYPQSQAVWNEWRPEDWRAVTTYVVLKPDQDAKRLENKIQEVLSRYMGEEVRAHNRYHLQPLTRIYMYSRSDYGFEQPWYGDPERVYTMAGIGFMVLLIACINFMNLATARSARRAREVGIRKVAGAYRRQIALQFLGESVLTAVLSLLFALLLAKLFLPAFNALIGLHLVISEYELNWGTITLNWDDLVYLLPSLALLTLFVGLLAGSYPAFFLSAFQPVRVLKGGAHSKASGGGLRKVLGASDSDLVMLLSRDFLVLALVGSLIACPISYFGIDRWLQGFIYRVDLGIWQFLVGGCLAVVITFATVGFQALKATRANPVEALRHE